MILRSSVPAAGLIVALAAGLLALPACKKKDDDGPPDGDPLPLSLAPAGAELARFTLAHALVEDSNLFLRYERLREP